MFLCISLEYHVLKAAIFDAGVSPRNIDPKYNTGCHTGNDAGEFVQQFKLN